MTHSGEFVRTSRVTVACGHGPLRCGLDAAAGARWYAARRACGAHAPAASVDTTAPADDMALIRISCSRAML
jgi:hypothetical protein